MDVLLDAAARLGAGSHLLLVGAGAQARPQSNASFIDYVPDPRDVARILASCDAFVHANHQEPFGLVALEALACGLPLVGVASGGIAEIVDDTVGQLAPHADAGSLAEAVDALFSRDWRAVGAAARARAVERYGWDATFRGLLGLYGELTGRPSAEVVPLPRAN